MRKMRYAKQLLIMAAVAGILAALLVLGACSSNSKTVPSPTTPITTLPPTTLTTTPPAITPTTTVPVSTTSTTTPPATTPTSTTSPTAQSVTINLVAQAMAFNMKTITVPAGASVTINFDNKDSVPHNFALYTDSSASQSIYIGKVISGTTTVYTFTAPAIKGTYFFRCDVHPSIMTGSFIVQ